MEVLSGIVARNDKWQIDGWELPGHGEPYEDCGNIRFRGCLNVAEHHKALDRDQEGKAYVKAYRKSCFRPSCPTCYKSWVGREAGRIEFRLSYYAGKWRKSIHVSANPSPELWGLPFEKLRSLAYRALKKVGIVGGSMIYHTFRQDESKKWFFSPHFHVIGYGYHTGKYYEGWVIRNHGVRKSVFSTATYQLSHAGVNPKYHTVTWFGELSYQKLEAPPLVEEKPRCPLCGHELIKLRYIGGKDPPPGDEGDYFLDPGDWAEIYSRCNS